MHYNMPHILYIVISFLVIGIFSFIFRKVSEKTRKIILMTIAGLTLFTHLSTTFETMLTTPVSNWGAIGWNFYPYYFCNLIMFLLPIMYFGPKIFKKAAPFVLWASFFGGMITMAVPDFYNGTNLLTLGVFKSFLSHSFMILAFVYAVMSKDFKIEVKTTWIFPLGLLLCGPYGLFTNWLWIIKENHLGNSMYLNAPALEGTPFYGWTIAAIMVALVYSTAFTLDMLRKRKNKLNQQKKQRKKSKQKLT